MQEAHLRPVAIDFVLVVTVADDRIVGRVWVHDIKSLNGRSRRQQSGRRSGSVDKRSSVHDT